MIGRENRARMVADAEAAGGFWAARVTMLCKALDEVEAERDERYTAEQVGDLQASEAELVAGPLRREIVRLYGLMRGAEDRAEKAEAERDAWKASNAELGERLNRAEYERDEAENDAETRRDVSLTANATAREWQRVAAEQTRLERDRAQAAGAKAERYRLAWLSARSRADEAVAEVEELDDEANGLAAELSAHARTLRHVREALDAHPDTCDRYPDGEPFTCGWKSAVLDVRAAMDSGNR